MPRDIDPRINTVENAFLYNIDDLRYIISSNIEERRQDAKTGEEIVREEATNFNEYIKMLEANPTIKALHQRFDQIIERELCVCVNKSVFHIGFMVPAILFRFPLILRFG